MVITGKVSLASESGAPFQPSEPARDAAVILYVCKTSSAGEWLPTGDVEGVMGEQDYLQEVEPLPDHLVITTKLA